MRTFIAIDLDDAVKRRLAELAERLRSRCPPLKWTDPDSVHITLKFLGDISERQIEPIGCALDDLARACEPFDIGLEHLGTFGQTAPVRVVWIGLRDDAGELSRCHARCEDLLEPLGIARENRPFRPHLTLARNRNPKHSRQIRQAVESAGETNLGVQTAGAITFYQSTLTPRGPIHRVLSRHAFASAR